MRKSLVISLFILVTSVLIADIVYTSQSQNPKQPSEARYPLVAFVKGSYGNADLWTADSQGGTRKITNLGNVDHIFNWSPDNKQIIISFIFKQKEKDYTAIVGVLDGKITKLPKLSYGNFVWSSDSKSVTYFNGKKLETFDLKGKINEGPKILDEVINIGQLTLNNRADLIAYDDDIPDSRKRPDVFVYDVVGKNITKINATPGTTLLGWFGDSIIYQQNNELLSSTSDGGKKEVLLNLNKDGSYNGGFVNGNNIYYRAVDSKRKTRIFVYNMDDKKVVFSGDVSVGSGNTYYVTVFKNQLVAYKQLSPELESFVLDLVTNQKSVICSKVDCSNFVWQN